MQRVGWPCFVTTRESRETENSEAGTKNAEVCATSEEEPT